MGLKLRWGEHGFLLLKPVPNPFPVSTLSGATITEACWFTSACTTDIGLPFLSPLTSSHSPPPSGLSLVVLQVSRGMLWVVFCMIRSKCSGVFKLICIELRHACSLNARRWHWVCLSVASLFPPLSLSDMHMRDHNDNMDGSCKCYLSFSIILNLWYAALLTIVNNLQCNYYDFFFLHLLILQSLTTNVLNLVVVLCDSLTHSALTQLCLSNDPVYLSCTMVTTSICPSVSQGGYPAAAYRFAQPTAVTGATAAAAAAAYSDR